MITVNCGLQLAGGQSSENSEVESTQKVLMMTVMEWSKHVKESKKAYERIKVSSVVEDETVENTSPVVAKVEPPSFSETTRMYYPSPGLIPKGSRDSGVC